MIPAAGLPVVTEAALRRVSCVRRGVRVRAPVLPPLRGVRRISRSSVARGDLAGKLHAAAVEVPVRRAVAYPAKGKSRRRIRRGRFRRLTVRLGPGGSDKPSCRVH